MNLDNAISLMKNHSSGYCLWVGAGVSIHLGGRNESGENRVPGWDDLVKRLGGSPNTYDFPKELSVVKSRHGRTRFQQLLREQIIVSIRESIIDSARKWNTPENCVPTVARQIAQLGVPANPIVNFNIESVTSTILAFPGGPYTLKFHEPSNSSRVAGVRFEGGRAYPYGFHRHVHHPHGIITHSGDCVLTAEDYDDLKDTLAFQLALHVSFQSHVMIVGMSLNDVYLRDQIAKYRRHLREVLWFRDSDVIEDQVMSQWVERNNISVVDVGAWPNFWETIHRELPKPDELQLLEMWRAVLIEAVFCDDFSIREHIKNFLPPHKVSHFDDFCVGLGLSDSERETMSSLIELLKELAQPVDVAIKRLEMKHSNR